MTESERRAFEIAAVATDYVAMYEQYKSEHIAYNIWFMKNRNRSNNPIAPDTPDRSKSESEKLYDKLRELVEEYNK